MTRLVQLIGAVPVRQVFDAAHEQLCRADEQAQAGEGLRDDLEPKAADKPRLDELEAGVEEAERCHDPAVPPGRVPGRDFLMGELARAVGLARSWVAKRVTNRSGIEKHGSPGRT